MHAHVQQRQPSVALKPGLPVGNGAHLDGSEHRLAKVAAIKKCLQRANGLVPPHILIHCKCDPRIGTNLGDLPRLVVVVTKRLLGEDPFQFRPGRDAAFFTTPSCWSGGSAISRISIDGSAMRSSILS